MPRNKNKPSANEPSEAQLAAREAGAARLRAAAKARKDGLSRQAEPIGRTKPVRSRRLDLNADEQQIGQDAPRKMKSTGKAMYEYDTPQVIERVGTPSKDKLDALAFNEEILTVMVHDSTNPTDEPIPYVINGGRRQAFLRGKEQKVRRKFVEILARMKPSSYTQRKYKDDQGIDGIATIPHSALRFPFSVIHDPNPKGADWLKNILAEV